MDLADRLQDLAARAPSLLDHAETEEATKNALVMPFITALGYNVFDPREVIPEYTADVGVKKGEKVDYAVMRDGRPIILFECKVGTGDLRIEHMGQLYRYFSVTPARIGILTNGVRYEFYSDLDAPNKMDERPFLVVDLTQLRDTDIDELERLTKDAFDEDELVTAAEELKYSGAIRRYLAASFAEPDEHFERLLIDAAYDGVVTKKVRDRFKPMIRRALRQFITGEVKDRLRSALERETPVEDAPDPEAGADSDSQADEVDDGIETTADEWEGYFIVKAILRKTVEPERVAIRDLRSYCGVLLDDNNRKPICRLHFDRAQKYIGLFDAEKSETRHPIATLNDIYDHADALRETARRYDES